MQSCPRQLPAKRTAKRPAGGGGANRALGPEAGRQAPTQVGHRPGHEREANPTKHLAARHGSGKAAEGIGPHDMLANQPADGHGLRVAQHLEEVALQHGGLLETIDNGLPISI
jgi:hypothetical protein